MTTSFIEQITTKGHTVFMEHAGFKASLKRAERLTGDGVHGLPPGVNVPVFPIAALPGCPDSWIREAGTYVCPVDPDWGLWFDWTMNDRMNTAIVPSVKGMNPITGEKINYIALEQYKDKCPKHDIPLGHARYCEKCGYKLPPQNYVCYPNILWWDGFRQPDGTVAQFFFTEDEKRDIASLVIGEENTVPAFGFAFFKTKVHREDPRRINNMTFGYHPDKKIVSKKLVDFDTYTSGDNIDYSAPISCSSVSYDSQKGLKDHQILRHFSRSIDDDSESKDRYAAKSVSVGAGAKINQNIEADNLDISDWKDTESAVIRLYFCFRNEIEKIINRGGVKDIEGDKEGFLKGLPQG